MLKYVFFKNLFFAALVLLSYQKSDSVIIDETDTDEKTLDDSILSEVVLEADGAGETYELINSVLAPGYNIVETPDCSHEAFGRHIDEVFDTELNKNVFRFFIHVTPDNDRCKKFDRQRNEIKSYDKSPDELKGIQGEKVVYSWKFRLSDDFQSSKNFTHIHQIKSVGGSESSMPLITFTLRKGSPDKLELRYAENTSQVTLTKVDLASFKGQWVEVVETIVFGEKGVGNYEIEIKDVKSQKTLLSYLNNDIRMWKTAADFMRPKWGIYRSLKDAESLKDETILFADFNIKEIEN